MPLHKKYNEKSTCNFLSSNIPKVSVAHTWDVRVLATRKNQVKLGMNVGIMQCSQINQGDLYTTYHEVVDHGSKILENHDLFKEKKK